MSISDGIYRAPAVAFIDLKCAWNSFSAAFRSAFSASSRVFFSLIADEHGVVARAHELDELVLRGADVGDRDFVEEAVDAGVEDRHLLLDGQRRVLLLLQHFNEPRAAIELLLRRLVEVAAAELRERRQLADTARGRVAACRPPGASP